MQCDINTFFSVFFSLNYVPSQRLTFWAQKWNVKGGKNRFSWARHCCIWQSSMTFILSSKIKLEKVSPQVFISRKSHRKAALPTSQHPEDCHAPGRLCGRFSETVWGHWDMTGMRLSVRPVVKESEIKRLFFHVQKKYSRGDNSQSEL